MKHDSHASNMYAKNIEKLMELDWRGGHIIIIMCITITLIKMSILIKTYGYKTNYS
jgi:hypothetical protein